MTGSTRDGIYLLILGCVVFILLGTALEMVSTTSMTDLRAYYYSARCLIEHRDPYNAREVLSLYRAEERERPNDSEKNREVITKFIYFPPTLVLTAPLAALPFSVARLIWMMLSAASLILASFAAWDLAAEYAPVLAGALVALVVANSELILITGNSVGIAVGLCVLSMWCFARSRYVWAGILCMALSLMLKPHDAGLLWVYLILAGGAFRRHAWRIFAVAAGLSAPGLIWVSVAAPRWVQELRANMAALSVHGGIADPGPSSSGAHALAMQINLQTAVSAFWDDPRFYNPVSYVICACLFLVWLMKVVGRKRSSEPDWIAIAFLCALSLLPVYHRQDDAKLLLLAIPACAMMWARRGRMAKLTLLVTLAGLVVTAEIPWAVFLTVLRHVQLPDQQWVQWSLMGIQVMPVPVTLLAMCLFYLWLLRNEQTSSKTN